MTSGSSSARYARWACPSIDQPASGEGSGGEDEGVEAETPALEGARLRLRPILMTSFAFIFGCIPLWVATGAGAAARRMLGTAVVSGMLAATLLGIFFIPALFVIVERLAGTRKKTDSAQALPKPDVY